MIVPRWWRSHPREARGGGAFGVTDGTVAITGGSAELQPVPLERQQAPEVVAAPGGAARGAGVGRRRRLGLDGGGDSFGRAS